MYLRSIRAMILHGTQVVHFFAIYNYNIPLMFGVQFRDEQFLQDQKNQCSPIREYWCQSSNCELMLGN
jgi:hypothetical protein